MILPKTLKILYKTYTVIPDDNMCTKHHCLGITFPDTQETFVKELGEAFTEENQSEVFLHEILHNIVSVFGLELTEEEVNALSVGLFTVIRDNDLDFRETKVTKSTKK